MNSHNLTGAGQPNPVVPGRLAGTRSIVTGAARGLGRAIADRLSAEGSQVTGLDLLPPEEPSSPNQTYVVCDVTDEDQVRAAVAEVVHGGGLDILVNNAGLLEPRRSLREVSPAELHRYVGVNAVGPLLMVQAGFDALAASPWRGRVINIGSRTFFTGATGQPAYVASKGALLGLTRIMAHELAEHGATANAVIPSQLSTPGTRAYTKQEAFERTMNAQALKQFVTAEDVAGSVAFLASPDGVMMTGQTLVCDGGGLML